MQIQVKWKDTGRRKIFKDIKYRNMIIKRFNGGWIIKGIVPDDTNIYHCILCAQNAIDEHLKGKTRKDASARHAHGIRIVGSIGSMKES